MKAAVLRSNTGVFCLEEIDIGQPSGREVLVQVKACGLCHSDLRLATFDYGTPLPAVLGHELAGIVLEIGPEVRDFAVGDHVVGSLVQFCGRCLSCLSGRTYQCERPEETLRRPDQASRLTQDGEPVTSGWGTAAFAERTLVHENQLVRVPKELPFPQASLLGCSVITGAGAAVNTAGVRPGESVVVIGVGGVGLNVIAGAKLAGASQIVAVDTQPKKEELARRFGATSFVDPSKADPVALVRDLTNGGAHHAFEVVGLKPTSESAIRMLRPGGGAYLIGLHKPGGLIDVDGLGAIVNQIKVQGVYMGSSNIKHDIPLYADLYLQGRFNLDDLISREINLAEINDAYEDLKHGAVARSVITTF